MWATLTRIENGRNTEILGSDKSLFEISLETDRGRLASVGDGCGAKGVDWDECSNRLARITFAQIDKLVGLDVG